jgi:sulfatase-modifying factor enzyme 1
MTRKFDLFGNRPHLSLHSPAMYLRLGLDPRVFLPLIMLGGLAVSLAWSGGAGRHAPSTSLVSTGDAPEIVSFGKSAETLPRQLDPAASLAPARPVSPPSPWLTPSRVSAPDPANSPDNGPNQPAPALADMSDDTCPEGMVLVDGDYCPNLGHVCLKRLEGEVERCAEYAAPPICEGPLQKKRFCIDRFEYPNMEGVRPAVMVNWHEAQTACEAENKRLCTSSEWTLACEGSDRTPYPYGYTRDATACNIDRAHPEVDADALLDPHTVASEVARLDQRVPSGQMTRCKSSYGVQDMTGNVDEWVLNEKHFGPAPADGTERPFISALKGGYWGPVRNRCRATTTAHDEWFRYYEVGFRCCANAP